MADDPYWDDLVARGEGRYEEIPNANPDEYGYEELSATPAPATPLYTEADIGESDTYRDDNRSGQSTTQRGTRGYEGNVSTPPHDLPTQDYSGLAAHSYGAGADWGTDVSLSGMLANQAAREMINKEYATGLEQAKKEQEFRELPEVEDLRRAERAGKIETAQLVPRKQRFELEKAEAEERELGAARRAETLRQAQLATQEKEAAMRREQQKVVEKSDAWADYNRNLKELDRQLEIYHKSGGQPTGTRTSAGQKQRPEGISDQAYAYAKNQLRQDHMLRLQSIEGKYSTPAAQQAIPGAQMGMQPFQMAPLTPGGAEPPAGQETPVYGAESYSDQPITGG